MQHFYTTSLMEKNSLLVPGSKVQDEGIACRVRYTTPFYRFRNTWNGEHFYTASPFEARVMYDPTFKRPAAPEQYLSEGIACEVFPYPYAGTEEPGGTLQILYRYLNTTSGDHFYFTLDTDKEPDVRSAGYHPDGGGVACTIPLNGNLGPVTPLHRLFNPTTGDHFYTIDDQERRDVAALYGYTDERISYEVIPGPFTTPLCRLFNRDKGRHLYSIEINEIATAIVTGYNVEGLICGVFAQPQGGALPTVPLHRLYHPTLDDHLYTVSDAEVQQINTPDQYHIEGDPFHVYPADSEAPYTTPLYRLLMP